MKRTPLKRKTRLSPVSRRRSKQLREYSKLRKAYMEKHPMCEICTTCKATDIHHRKGRWKERCNDVAFWMAVCRECHSCIHELPAWAYSKGYLLPR